MSILKKLLVKYKCFLKKHILINQFCKKCGKDMHYDYSVSDEDWSKLSKKYQNHVLCLDCFVEEYPEHEVDVKLFL